MKKSILIIGVGRFGRHAAIKLMELGHQVMAVDIDENKVEAILPNVTNALIGDSTRQDFLKSIGIKDYDVVLITIGDNFQNSLETTSLVKELGARFVVARASRDVHAKFLIKNGADEVVYPEKQMARWAATTYSSENIFDYFAMGDGYTVMEIKVPKSWVGREVGELDVRKKHHINIMAIKVDHKLDMRITHNTKFSGDEKILVLGKETDIQNLVR